MADLRTISRTTLTPRALLQEHGTIVATFDRRGQGSGNLCYGLRTEHGDFFVKTAGDAADPAPTLRFADRVRLLHSAAALYFSCPHPALATLHTTIETPRGPALVYTWADGAPLRGRLLPQERALTVLDRLYALHAQLARCGWIAADLYDESLLYDDDTDTLTVIDLDLYQPAPFRNQMGRMFGSSHFMAPEEFQKGAIIDQKTTTFVLGRAACVLAPDLDSPTVRRACQPDRDRRFETVAHFWRAWQAERLTA
ncbi:MAG: serine/threonine protein kinase [Myxococcota bacterium]|jgi:serine/threonine protein kinase